MIEARSFHENYNLGNDKNLSVDLADASPLFLLRRIYFLTHKFFLMLSLMEQFIPLLMKEEFLCLMF